MQWWKKNGKIGLHGEQMRKNVFGIWPSAQCFILFGFGQEFSFWCIPTNNSASSGPDVMGGARCCCSSLYKFLWIHSTKHTVFSTNSLQINLYYKTVWPYFRLPCAVSFSYFLRTATCYTSRVGIWQIWLDCFYRVTDTFVPKCCLEFGLWFEQQKIWKCFPLMFGKAYLAERPIYFANLIIHDYKS